MLWLAVLALQASPSIAQIDSLVKAKDVAGLTKLLEPLPKGSRNPFAILATGGAYEVGRFGWSASELPSVDQGPAYVVIGTQLTSEDIGEILLERDGLKLKYVPEAETMGVHIDHHSFIVKFHPETKKVDLVDKVSFGAAPGTHRFVVRFSPQYKVTRVEDANGHMVAFKQAGGTVLLRRPPESHFDYRMFYGATVDLPGYAGSISANEATLTNDYWYPMIGRNPAPFDTEVHAPTNWTAVAQGDLVSTERSTTESITRYRMDLPVTYYSVSAAPYSVVTRTYEGRSFSVWSLRMSKDAMEAQTELLPPILKFFEAFCPYPFKGYGFVDSAVYGGGALEAYSFATYGGGLPIEDPHEPSHTWWGGIMDNTYLNSFWNESFAVYCEGLYRRNAPIGNGDDRKVAFIQDGSGNPDYDSTAVIDAGVDAGAVAGSLGYGKGSKVLQMLEQLVGTSKMIQIMHDWIAKHKQGTAADWEEFIQTAKTDAPDLKLDGFFNDWLRRPGYAHFTANVAYDGAATLVHLNWTGPRFRMPLKVLTRDGSGVDSLHSFDTVEGDDFRIPGPKPMLVSIDPYRQALRDISPNETPVQLDSIQIDRKLVDPEHKDWLTNVQGDARPAPDQFDPSGAFIVGSPESIPIMKSLCDKVGFKVVGNSLTYKSTTIDLRHGAALAVVDLGNGKFCKIGLGMTRVPPSFGRARLVLTDDLGRFLAGATDPKTSGKLVTQLN